MTERTPRAPDAPSAAAPPRPEIPDPHPDSATGTGPMSATLAPPLPAAPHAPSAPRSPEATGRALVARLFAGSFEFTPFAAAVPAVADRTPAERDAVARAAACPDLFAVHADPVAGGRFVADVARAATGRVLILTPNEQAADKFVERLAALDVPVLRALADGENPARGVPAAHRATSAARLSGPEEGARREAAARLAAAERRAAAFAPVAKVVARLVEAEIELTRADAARAAHVVCRARAEAEVRTETDTPFARAAAELRATRAAERAALETELRATEADRATKSDELAKAREQLSDAQKKPGFFARVFGGKPKPGAPDPGELERAVRALEDEVAALTARTADLSARLDAAGAAHATELEERVTAEVAARQRACDALLTATEADCARGRAEVHALKKVIAGAVPGDDPAAAEAELAAARAAHADAESAARAARGRALVEPRAVVGVPLCVGADPVFDALPADEPFDLLVLDRAELLPEPEFVRLSRLAKRWLLVGDASAPAPARNGRRAEVPFFARAVAALDREPLVPEGPRYVFRLLPPVARRALTREPLADRPEIELRFVADEAEPVVAEIAFPAALPVPDAKAFLCGELSEVRLRPLGAPVWNDLEVSWPAVGAGGAWVNLEPSVRERVVGSGAAAFTAALNFDAAAGWTAESAAEWIASRLPPPGSRFAALPRI